MNKIQIVPYVAQSEMPCPAKDEGTYMFFDTENSNKLTFVKNVNGASVFFLLEFPVPTLLTFTGDIDGVNKVFVCSSVPSQVFKNGQLQYIDVNYTLVNKTVTFVEAPLYDAETPSNSDELEFWGNV